MSQVSGPNESISNYSHLEELEKKFNDHQKENNKTAPSVAKDDIKNTAAITDSGTNQRY